MAHDLFLLAPAFIVLMTGLLVMIADVFALKSHKSYLAYITVAGNVIAGMFAFYLLKKGGDQLVIPYFASMLFVNAYSLFFVMLVLGASTLVALFSASYADKRGCGYGEYYSLLNFATFGMIMLVQSNNMISLFLALEVMSISAYVLAGIRRRWLRSTEASMKYFIMGAFSSALLLYGVALLYGLTGETNLQGIHDKLYALHRAGNLSITMLVASISLLLAAFGFKISAVPFHSWAPDVYEGSPTPISGFFAAGVKAASFAALLKVLFTIDVGPLLPVGIKLHTVLYWLAILTMSVGNLVALYQKNIKRMLAYSSISHAGYLLIGVMAQNALGGSAVGTGDFGVTSSMLFYLMVYGGGTLGCFGILSLLDRKGEECVELADFNGLSQRTPFLALMMLVFLISLAGIPPTGGFIGKYYLFAEVLAAGSRVGAQEPFVWIIVIAVVNSVISVYYYLHVVVAMYMRPQAEHVEAHVSRGAFVGLALALTLILHAGLFPGNYLEQAKKSGAAIHAHLAPRTAADTRAPKAVLLEKNKRVNLAK